MIQISLFLAFWIARKTEISVSGKRWRGRAGAVAVKGMPFGEYRGLRSARRKREREVAQLQSQPRIQKGVQGVCRFSGDEHDRSP